MLIVFSMIELASYGIYKIIIVPRAAFLAYQPPESVNYIAYKNYLTDRDDLLGWPAQSERATPRFTPAFPQPGEECLSLYGDSFVFAHDVDDEYAWGNILSEKLNCRVANFGVAGYGTDQAYLRFLYQSADQAPITILGFFPENGLRNVNQYRYLLSGGELFSFKPRFILEDENLRLIPLPTITYEELPAFFQAPKQYLAYETFFPGSDYGSVPFSFPYSFHLVQAASQEQTINWLLNKPSWEKFLHPGHPTGAFEITTSIMEAFVTECNLRNKRCLVLFFPSPSSFAWYHEQHTLAIQPLIDELNAQGIEQLALTPALSQILDGESFCEILSIPERCAGHFNERGNYMIADIVANHLLQIKWLPETAP